MCCVVSVMAASWSCAPHNESSHHLCSHLHKPCRDSKDNSIPHVIIDQIQADKINMCLTYPLIFLYILCHDLINCCAFSRIYLKVPPSSNEWWITPAVGCTNRDTSILTRVKLRRDTQHRFIYFARGICLRRWDAADRSMTGLCGQLWALSCAAPTIIYPPGSIMKY